MDPISFDPESALRTVLPEWGLSPETPLRLLSVSENITYRADAPDSDTTLIFRIHRPNYHAKAEIISELAWVRSLREDEVVETPPGLPTEGGEWLAELGKEYDGRHVTAFGFMEGSEPLPSDDLTKWFERLGTLSARLHAHSRAWRPPAYFSRKLWNFDNILGDQPYWGDWRQAIGLTPEGRSILEKTVLRLRHQLETYGTDKDRFGLIHCDMRLDNLLIHGERLGVIDFDDCGFSWLGYDFAGSVSFMEHEPFIDDLKAAWLTGYRTEGNDLPELETILPTLIMLRRIQLTAWIASRPEASVAQSIGGSYTEGTVELAERHLARSIRRLG